MNELNLELSTETDLVTSGSEFRPLDSNYVVAERLGGLIALAIITIFAIFVMAGIWFFRGFDWIILGIAIATLLLLALVAFGSLYWPHLEFMHTSWKLDDESLEIHRGILWKRQISVPLGRVQHADVSQGPLQRRFGLGTLIVHTAGSYEASVELEGLNHDVALQLRDQLIRQTQQATLDQ